MALEVAEAEQVRDDEQLDESGERCIGFEAELELRGGREAERAVIELVEILGDSPAGFERRGNRRRVRGGELE